MAQRRIEKVHMKEPPIFWILLSLLMMGSFLVTYNSRSSVLIEGERKYRESLTEWENNLPPVEFINVGRPQITQRSFGVFDCLAPHPVAPPIGNPCGYVQEIEGKRYLVEWDGYELTMIKLDQKWYERIYRAVKGKILSWWWSL